MDRYRVTLGPGATDVSSRSNRTVARDAADTGPAVNRSANQADGRTLAGAPQAQSRAAAASPVATGSGFEYSALQKAVIGCDDKVIVVEAKAGAGKSTTARGYTQARPSQQFYYVCLNTANAAEARSKFGRNSNVTVTTAHGLAFSDMRSLVGSRLAEKWNVMSVMEDLGLRNYREGAAVKSVLESFFQSTDQRIEGRHCNEVAQRLKLAAYERQNALQRAAEVWQKLFQPDCTYSVPHDAYLKAYSLKKPQLQVDRVIFDEAQDANPVLLQIVKEQRQAGLLCLGDRHQSIYQFMGAVNGMEQFAAHPDATVLFLNETRRFGPGVASLANELLSRLKGETVPIIGLGQDGPWVDDGHAILSRTNAQLFALAAERSEDPIYWSGGIKKYRVEQLIDAYNFKCQRMDLVRDWTMKNARHWESYQRYAKETGDTDARILVELVERYGDEIPDLVDRLKRNAVEDKNRAAVVLGTAHGAKGLEYNCVSLAPDFEGISSEYAKRCAGDEFDEQFVNLLYVAITRAKHNVRLPSEIQGWFDELGQASIEGGQANGDRVPATEVRRMFAAVNRDHVAAMRLR